MSEGTLKSFFALIGFVVVFLILSKLVGGIFFFALKFIIPIAIIYWIYRALSNNRRY